MLFFRGFLRTQRKKWIKQQFVLTLKGFFFLIYRRTFLWHIPFQSIKSFNAQILNPNNYSVNSSANSHRHIVNTPTLLPTRQSTNVMSNKLPTRPDKTCTCLNLVIDYHNRPQKVVFIPFPIAYRSSQIIREHA